MQRLLEELKKMSDELPKNVNLRPKQEDAYRLLMKGQNIFLTGPAGCGKCLGKNTPVIMYDGTIKMVQDIFKGELVMGDDSTPRTVLNTTKGIDNLYKISTQKGDKYIVNSQHVLTFKSTKSIKYKNGKFTVSWGDINGKVKHQTFTDQNNAKNFTSTLPDLVDIPISQCLEYNKHRYWNEHFQGVYTGLDFPHKELELDPYMLGIWLGNGHTDSPRIDEEIVEYLRLSNNGITCHDKNSKFLEKLCSIGVFGNKHIPSQYKTGSKKQRLELLAGLLDTDGILDSNVFEITQKNKSLAEDIYFLARSLGFHTSIKEVVKWCIYKGEKREGVYYRLHISGNIDEIPTLIARKQATERKQIKDHLVSRISIESIGTGEYYGFELDDNHRFVLGNFIITHNSTLIKLFRRSQQHSRNIAITSTTGTSALLIGGTTLHSYLGIGLGTGSVDSITSKIFKFAWLRKRWNELDALIIDEVSMLSPELFDKLEEIARIVRHDERPFGGIQLILSGDFCFAGNTDIMLYNGCTKKAKDIVVGDILMGDDSTQRKVTKLFRGKAPMYEITYPRGCEPFTVTGNHILCMKPTMHKKIYWSDSKDMWIAHWWDIKTNKQRNKTFSVKKYGNKSDANTSATNFVEQIGDIDHIEISVNEYNSLNINSKSRLACYKSGIIDWKQDNTIEIHPWLLGAWLGDGHSDGKGFTNKDEDCINCFTEYLEHLDCKVEKYDKIPYRKKSQFKNLLEELGLINNKYIPDSYLYSSPKNRYELLAGLLDTDGHLYKYTKHTFVIFQKNETLAKQICFLARSLGLSASLTYKETKQPNKNYGVYDITSKGWNCIIGGEIHKIPCRIIYKQAHEMKDHQYDPLLMKIKVKYLPEDNFYGFETDKNKRFLLGDFTVTHNCQLPVIGSEKFCFEAESWSRCVPNTSYLDEIIRQNDPVFQDCLNHIRMGKCPKNIRKILEQRLHVELINDYGIQPTKLYSLNYDVDRVNDEELDKLAEDGREFKEYNMKTKVYGSVKDKMAVIEKFKKYCTAPESLQICVGAQVMLLINLDMENKLANGSRGVVTSFVGDIPVVRFLNGIERIIDFHVWEVEENEKKIMRVIQIPLKVAYAISIHKCCSENTLIYTANGIKRICKISSDLITNHEPYITKEIDLTIIGKTGLQKATQIYKGDIEKTVKITTSLGYTLEGSARHPVLTYNGYTETWKKLPEIQEGDYIVLKKNTQSFGTYISTKKFIRCKSKILYNIPENIDEDLCYLIGSLIGDGCYSVERDYPIEFIIAKDANNEFGKIFRRVFGQECKVYEYDSTYKLMVNSKLLRTFLFWCGLEYVTAEKKTIPWVVFENTMSSQISCLQGLFDTDGGVNKDCIHYTTVSHQLAIDIQIMLLNLGIISSLRKLCGKSREKFRQAYRIHITGYNAHLFYTTIGFLNTKKQTKLYQQYGHYNCDIVKSNICDIPNGQNISNKLRSEIYSYYNDMEVCYREIPLKCRQLLSRLVSRTQKLRIEHVKYLYQNIPTIEKYGETGNFIKYVAENELFFVQVVQKEEGCTQLYDLYVPYDNTFIGNGIVNHNSQGCSLDYAEINLSDTFTYGQAYVALSRVKSLDGISLLGIDWDKIKAHPKALEFYENLTRQ